MTQLFIILMATTFTGLKNQDTTIKEFKAERVSKTATIQLNTTIQKVFSLFGAFEERNWADKWNPALVYPSVEQMEEGTTFKTPAHGHLEKEYLWMVSKYQPHDYLIQYLVLTENRYWTITIKCSPINNDATSAAITYTFTGLNEIGNEHNALALKSMFKKDLKDWEKAINYYLSTGKTLKE